jgi:hypothetical protein
VAWGDTSAAFSDKEWFAEVYAEWYKNGVGGDHIDFPDYVTNFFRTKVETLGQPAPTTGGASATSSSGASGATTGGAATAPDLPGMGTGGGSHPRVPRR